jgi:cytosine/adenosine deaminase-related metal-dependent hydrolase
MPQTIHLFTNAKLLPDWAGAQALCSGAIAWQGERILAVGESEHLLQLFPEAETTDLQGRLLAPGLVNAHHHIYSALAAGLEIPAPINNFLDCLQHLWWPLDRSLDEDSLRLSARLTALRCIQSGCTTIFDHHISPNAPGSLDILKEELEAAGLSAILCYETSDRNGVKLAQEGLEYNVDFAQRMQSNPRFRGTIGLHALFTLGDDTLKIASKAAQDFGCHLHLAESTLDAEINRGEYDLGLVERLQKFDLLGENMLFAHGTHLSREELETVSRSGSKLILNPESNANNQLGQIDLQLADQIMPRLHLGTDGMNSNMLSALRSTFILARQNSSNPLAAWQGCDRLLSSNARLAAQLFDDPKRACLCRGAYADFAVWNYRPTQGLSETNLLSHLVFGAAQTTLCHTIAAGKKVLHNGVIQSIDEDDLFLQLQAVQSNLWKRFRAQSNSFMGFQN